MEILKFILKCIGTIITLGIPIYFKQQKKIQALVTCIDKEKSTAKVLIEGIKKNGFTLKNVEDFLSPEKINNRLEIVQASFGLAGEIKKDVDKYLPKN